MNKSGDGDGSRAMYTVRLFYYFFYLRRDATGKVAGIVKNVNDESCSTRRALQIDLELRSAVWNYLGKVKEESSKVACSLFSIDRHCSSL